MPKAKLPFLSINMASSIDGKIASRLRGPIQMGSPFDRTRMRQLRKQADAVLMGATTFLAHPQPLTVGAGKKQPATVIISSRLQFPRKTPWERAHHIERWVFCGKKAPKGSIQYLESQGVRVVVCPSLRPRPKKIIQTLGKAGFQRLLLEGGGELNSDFLEQDLVDRIHLTLCPLLIGGREVPSLFEGKGFSPSRFTRWKLKEKFLRSGELYLTYERFHFQSK